MDSAHTIKDLQKLIGAFSVVSDNYTFNRIAQGLINDTYLVLKNGQPFYILQRINSEVFTDVPGVMGNITKALSYLSDKDYSLVALVPTKSGQSFCQFNNEEYWRLMKYIPDSQAHDSAKNTEIAYEAGKILGKFHSLLHSASSEQFVDTIPHFHDLHLRKEQFQEALKNASQQRQKKANLAIPFVSETLPLLMGLSEFKLPLRICHNDTKLNNILFSNKTNQALCFIDLDTIMKVIFIMILGIWSVPLPTRPKRMKKSTIKLHSTNDYLNPFWTDLLLLLLF
ncbi:MAG: phosphotransferase enzyme family protein [Flavobacteriales bacterium]